MMKKLFIVLLAAGVMAACSDDDKNNLQYITVDFENVPENILAVDAKGSNFYSEYDGDIYTEYTDKESGLHFGINYSVTEWSPTGYEFSNGGTVFSTWNKDLTINNWENQCTVNYVDSKTKLGGNKGSKVFGVVNGNAVIKFTESQENLIDHLYATNSVYTTLTMKNGNEFTNALSYEDEGYFCVTITGYSKTGTKTGSVDFYLADFRTAKSPGIVDSWTKVDLSSLGKVNRIEFSFTGSDSGEFGVNTPKYVCIDDIAIVKELE